MPSNTGEDIKLQLLKLHGFETFLFRTIQRINQETLKTRMLVLTSTGRLEQLQKMENIHQILCQYLAKDDLRNDRALNPCESIRRVT